MLAADVGVGPVAGGRDRHPQPLAASRARRPVALHAAVTAHATGDSFIVF